MAFNSRKAIKEHVKGLYPDIVAYDIYERLENKGLVCEVEFFRNDFFCVDNYFIRHKYVYCYRAASELEAKKGLLEAIIHLHVMVRDFFNVDLFIRDYIYLGFDIHNKYSGFSKELKLLFNEMSEISSKRENGAITIIIIDSLIPDYYQYMPFVKSLMRDKGVVFEKAYSFSSWTSSSYQAFLTGKDCVSGKSYKGNNLSEDDLGKLKDIINAGYKLKGYGYAEHMLYKLDMEMNRKEPRLKEIIGTFEPSSKHLWNFVCDYLSNDTRSLSILHMNDELHPPFLNSVYRNSIDLFLEYQQLVKAAIEKDKPLDSETLLKLYLKKYDDLTSMNTLFDETLSDGAQFIDTQLEFYFKFINMNIDTAVIMGDHGIGERVVARNIDKTKRDFKPTARISRNYKPFFGIASKNLTPGINRGFFSYINIFDLLYDFCEGNYDLKAYERDYIYCSDCPFYDLESLSLIIKLRNCDNAIYGVAHIITDVDRYSYYFNGKEYYCLLSDEAANLINDEAYSFRIAELKDKLGKIDTERIYAQKKFDKTRDVLLGCDNADNLIDGAYDKYINEIAKEIRRYLPFHPSAYKKTIELS